MQSSKIICAAMGAILSVLGPSQEALAQRELKAITQDLEEGNRTTFLGFVRRFVAMKPPYSDRSANDLGWDCLAAAELAQASVPGAEDRLSNAAIALLDKGLQRPDGALGWTAARNAAREGDCAVGAHPSITPGRCIPAGTAYSFQSGLAVTCLAIAGELLSRPHWVVVAKRSFTHWDSLRSGALPGCNECLYYWYDDAGVDAQRYVRNLSLFMGLGAAALAREEPQLAAVAQAVIRSDIWERSGGNRGYLGRLDPLWSNRAGESARTENHMAVMALITDLASELIGFEDGTRHAFELWKDWATCDEKRCQTAGCRYWSGDPQKCVNTATFTSCLFRRRDSLAKLRCNEAIGKNDGISPYSILAIVLGGKK